MAEKEIEHACAKDIMTPHVFMLPTTAKFQDVLKVMKERNISAVFLHNPHANQYYIVSQTDMINFLSNGGINDPLLPEVTVSRFMNGPIQTIEENISVDIVIRFMAEHRYKRVLISKDGKPSGVISTRDVLMWNDSYFKKSRPQVLLFMDNETSIFIGRYIFEENIDEKMDRDLMELYGAALGSISSITDEILKQKGNMKRLVKENHTIFFEPFNEITGILICDGNSLDLLHHLHDATQLFYKIHYVVIKSEVYKNGLKANLDLSAILPMFKKISPLIRPK